MRILFVIAKIKLVNDYPYTSKKDPFVYTGGMVRKKVTVRTGSKIKVSGQYRAGNGKTEDTFVKGKRAAPAKGKGQTWRLVDGTRHKKTKKRR